MSDDRSTPASRSQLGARRAGRIKWRLAKVVAGRHSAGCDLAPTHDHRRVARSDSHPTACFDATKASMRIMVEVRRVRSVKAARGRQLTQARCVTAPCSTRPRLATHRSRHRPQPRVVLAERLPRSTACPCSSLPIHDPVHRVPLKICNGPPIGRDWIPPRERDTV